MSGVVDVLATVHAKAKMLSEALPYMQRYDRKTVVVKYGGHAMGDPELAADFARDIVLIKQAGVNPIVVHGGGPQIGSLLERLNIRVEFKGGLRVTDRETVEVVEMVLAGSVNKEIVTAINSQGGKAVGISGKDANLMRAKRLERRWRDPSSNIEQIVDLGFVGDPAHVDTHIIDVIINSDLIPVVAPIGVGPDGETLNINADTFAAALASALKAKRLLLLTDVEGVLDREGQLIKSLTTAEAQALIDDGTISRRHDPQDRELHRRHCRRRRGRGHYQRQGAARGAARVVHRARRGHADRAAAAEAGESVMSGRPDPASGFAHVEAWVFDLDNTLYPADCNLFAQIDKRMGEFIIAELGPAARTGAEHARDLLLPARHHAGRAGAAPRRVAG